RSDAMSTLDQAFIRAYQPPATPQPQPVATPAADARTPSASTPKSAAESAEVQGSPKRRPRKSASVKKNTPPTATESAPLPRQSAPPTKVTEATPSTIAASPTASVSPPSRRLPLSSFAQTPPMEPG